MSLRRDTLLRAHSLPDANKRSSNKSHQAKPSSTASSLSSSTKSLTPASSTEDVEKKLRRRSVFSIPLFTPLRRSSSKKSRSLEGSPDPAPSTWRRNEKVKSKTPTDSPKKSLFHLYRNSCSEVYRSPKHAPCSSSEKQTFEHSPCKEKMVSGSQVMTKSEYSERKWTNCQKNKSLIGLTHEDVMNHIQNGSIDLSDNEHIYSSQISLHSSRNGCTRGDHSNASSAASSPRLPPRHEAEHRNNSSYESCPETGKQDGADDTVFKLSRNFSLPIRVQHKFTTSNVATASPKTTRKMNNNEDNENTIQLRSYSESYSSARTPRKFKVYQAKFDSMSNQDYVQLLYGTLPRDEADQNNNADVVFVPLSSAIFSTDTTPIPSTDTTPMGSPLDSPGTPNKRHKLFGFSSPKYRKSPATSPKKSPSKTVSPRKSSKSYYDPDKESLTGFLFVSLHYGKGFAKNSDTYVILEMDSYGHFFKKAKTKPCRGSDPSWEEAFEFEIEACNTLKLTCFNKLRLMGDDISGKCTINLTREKLTDNRNHTLSVSLDRGQSILNISLCFSTSIDGIKKSPSFSDTGVFGVPIQVVCKREKFDIPVIVLSCIKEIEKRGMDEIGIYRLSGVASEIQQLKKLFNEQTQNALLVLADTDIHAVAGLLKLYLRELPQSLFTSKLYRKFVQGLSITDSEEKELYMVEVLHQLPKPNKITTLYLFDHLRRVTLLEETNKMGTNNLATVFGPTVLRPPSSNSDKENETSSCNVGTFDIGALDVMSQVGIFRYFLGLKNNERTKLPADDLELWRRLDPEKATKMEEDLMITAEEHLI